MMQHVTQQIIAEQQRSARRKAHLARPKQQHSAAAPELSHQPVGLLIMRRHQCVGKPNLKSNGSNMPHSLRGSKRLQPAPVNTPCECSRHA